MSTMRELEAEKVWHEQLFGSRKVEFLKPEIKNRYLNPPEIPLFHKEYMFKCVGNVQGKRILCYGCGDSNVPTLLSIKGAEVWAFDISEEAIKLQQRMAKENNVEIVAVVSEAENLREFEDHSFDIVFGNQILHHLPNTLDMAAKEMKRVLKKGGYAIFSEPVLWNKIIFYLRKLFPKGNFSPRERQLNDRDWAVFKKYFSLTEFPFYIFSRFNQMILRGKILEDASSTKKFVIYSIAKLDHILLKRKLFRNLASVVVMKMEN
jgi:ubiquinone/menaquinone biosynthesis C-methylase UbiE